MPEMLSRSPMVLLAFLILALAEYGWRKHIAGISYDWRASLGSIGVAVGQVMIKSLTAGTVTAIFGAAYALAPLKLPVDDWRAWLAAFFAVEFAYYWFHRASHETNWFWATHAVHHSANEICLPAAIRLGWTGQVSGVWLFFLPLVLLGFAPVMVAGLLGANLIYQYALHTELVGKLWWPIEFVFNTPSHHRAHHSSNPGWLDINYGGVLIVFDRLFGTFVAEPAGGGLCYGLVKPLHSANPVRIAFHQWLLLARAVGAAHSWRQRAALLMGPPRLLDGDGQAGKVRDGGDATPLRGQMT